MASLGKLIIGMSWDDAQIKMFQDADNMRIHGQPPKNVNMKNNIIQLNDDYYYKYVSFNQDINKFVDVLATDFEFTTSVLRNGDIDKIISIIEIMRINHTEKVEIHLLEEMNQNQN